MKMTRIVFRHQKRKRREPNLNDLRVFERHRNVQHRRASCDDRRRRWAAFESLARSRDCEQTSHDLPKFAQLFQPERRRCWWFRRGLHLQCICHLGCKRDLAWTFRFADRALAQTFQCRHCTKRSFRRSSRKWRICCLVRRRLSTSQLGRVRFGSGAFHQWLATSRELSRVSCWRCLKEISWRLLSGSTFERWKLTFSIRRNIHRNNAQGMSRETMNMLNSVGSNSPNLHFRRFRANANGTRYNKIKVLAFIFYRLWLLLNCFIIRLLFVMLLLIGVGSMLTPSASPKIWN